MPYQDEALNQLIINKLSQNQYNELAEAGAISANQLYFVEADGDIDAASGTIENVADPINNTDAANKQYVDNTISSNLSNLSSTVSSNYALKTDIPTAEDLGLSNYAPLSTVTNLNNSLSSVYSTKSDVTYVSSQVSGIPSTITSLSSTVSSTYALKTDIPTAEDLGLSNYAAVSTVTDISNTLSGYATNSNVNSISSALNTNITYVSSQVSSLPSDILDMSNSLSGYATLQYVTDSLSGVDLTNYAAVSTVTNLNNSLSGYAKTLDIIYVSSQVSGISNDITNLSSNISSTYTLLSTTTELSNSLSSKLDVPTNTMTVYGTEAKASNNGFGIAIGYQTYAKTSGLFDNDSIVIGKGISANPVTILIGNVEHNVSSDTNSIGITQSVNTKKSKVGYKSIAIGHDSLSSIDESIVIGDLATAVSGSIAIGRSLRNISTDSIAIGEDIEASDKSIAIGNDVDVYDGKIAIGNDIHFDTTNENKRIIIQSVSSTTVDNVTTTYPWNISLDVDGKIHSHGPNLQPGVDYNYVDTNLLRDTLSSYVLSSEVSSTINKVSNIASSLSALSDISQIPAEYTVDTVVQKLNEVIIRINTLTTSLK